MSLDDDRIEQALARILESRRAGGSVAVEAIVAENPDLEEPLRARLRVFRMLDALREPPNGASRAPSALESLSRTGRIVRPVSLPEPAGEESPPVVLPQSPSGQWGRYSVQGEIARGGVGIVFKARDPDLGRDVALKVLREEHASSPEVLQRFVEEAQIGGQLQHPGVVPVYELGIGSDGQPYFAMKLVKGKTLAIALAARDAPAADRPRLLSVFLAVCQTVAYAHGRRIIHRDLKPSNVMVGAFGEVQVFDWGMAKVLAQGGAADDALAAESETQLQVHTVRSGSGSAPSAEGSVLGTPQYMAPEQARGEVGQLDERADVFSLGAILCEILTGKPPYTGTDREVLVAAAQGRLGPAHQRLRSCGADPSLGALAIRCLASEKADRPRDAGVLAHEITAHLASLEDRARTAEMSAVKARVVATQERRARRLTLSLSAAVVALVLVAGGAWYWVDHGRRVRAEAAARQVADALDEATRLGARAEAAAPQDAVPLWHDALASARRADAVGASGDADAETKARAAAAVSAIAVSQRRADLAAEDRRRDDAMAERLDGIRGQAGETGNWKAISAAYAAAFEGYLDGEVEALGVDETVRRISASSIREGLNRALRSWARARERAGEASGVHGEVLRRVDVDPWRVKLRETAGDLRALRSMADRVNFDTANVEDVLLLVSHLGDGGDPERAATLAFEAWGRHPGDFWACYECGKWNERRSPPRRREALRFYTAALAVRPRSVAAHISIGNLLQEEGDLDGAIGEFRKAIRLDPKAAQLHCALGAALGDKREFEDAVTEYREAIRLDPTAAQAHCDLASTLDDKGDLDGAIAEYREAIRLDPKAAQAHCDLGAALVNKGDSDGAIEEFRESIRLDPKDALSHSNLGAALVEKGDLDGAIMERREAARLDPENAMAHSNLGVALGQKGDHNSAIKEFREAIRLDSKLASAHADLGVSLSRSGDSDGAIEEFREAIRLDSTYLEAHWNLARILRDRGRLRESLESFRKAHELGSQRKRSPFPTAQEAQYAERLVAAAESLPAFVQGKADPPTAQDALDMAQAAYFVASFAASAMASARALGMEPALAGKLESGHRYNAACAAALAGAGKGTDAATLDAAARARWRRQAVEWLRADLAAWRKEVDASSVRLTLEHWREDSDLSGLRDADELAKASTEDREECRALWREVDALLAESRGRK